MKLTVTVTEADVSSGVPHSRQQCPIALAIKRATGREVFVGSRAVEFERPGGDPSDLYERVIMPPEAAAFVRAYDFWGAYGLPFCPVKFTFEVPDWVYCL